MGCHDKKFAIVLDGGGVLVSNPNYQQHLQLHTKDSMRDFLKISQNYQTGSIQKEQYFYELSKLLGISTYELKNIFDKIIEDMVVNNQLIQFLKEIKTDAHLLMFSNVSNFFINQDKFKEMFNVFDTLLFSCEMGVKKPKLKAFQILLDSIPNTVKTIILVDDRVSNLKVAKTFGIIPLRFENTSETIRRLKKHMASTPTSS